LIKENHLVGRSSIAKNENPSLVKEVLFIAFRSA